MPDLTNAALSAADAHRHAERAAAELRREQSRLSRRAGLRDFFAGTLDIVLAEADILDMRDRAVTIIDGVRLGAFLVDPSHQNHHGLIALVYVAADGHDTLPIDQSLHGRVRDLATLGMVLERARIKPFDVRFRTPGQSSSYQHRYYFPGVGLDHPEPERWR